MDVNLGTLLKLRTREWAISRGLVRDESGAREPDLYLDVIRPFLGEAFKHMPDQIVFGFADRMSRIIKKNIVPDVKALQQEMLAQRRGEAFAPLTVIVLQYNDNGHNYPLNEPIICIGNSRAWKVTSGGLDVGNNLPSDLNNARPATDEEIDKIMESFKVEFLGKILDMHQSVPVKNNKTPTGVVKVVDIP